MQNILAVIWIGIMICSVVPGTASAQVGTSVFVVYGTMYQADRVTPVETDYLITVEIKLKDRTSTLYLGENEPPGKYSVVWIEQMGDLVVELGDEIMVKAEKEGEGAFGVFHTVTLADIVTNKVMLNIHWEDIAAYSQTWGAIKSMYK